MIHRGIVCIWTLLCYCNGLECTICSEAAASQKVEVIRMCQSGSLKADRVVIDTYDTGDPDVHSCTCTARQYMTSSYLVSIGSAYQTQQNKNCGSMLSVVSQGTDSLNYECVWPDKVNSEKRSSLDFILSRTKVGNPWQYGYCILLETDFMYLDNNKWNITCLPPVKVTTIAATSTTAISTGSGVTASSSSVSISPITPESSTDKICSQQTVEVFSSATVIVPIVVVVLIAVVTTIANVILYRRRLAIDKESKNTEHVLQPTGSVVYDSIDIDRLEPPHTYANTTAGRMYANTAAGVTVS